MNQTIRRPSMLVVENHEHVRAALGETGRRAGFEVVAAGRGHEAIEILATRAFDVVVIDLTLARMQAADLLAYYGGRHPGRRNVIAISSGGAAQLMQIDPSEVFAFVAAPVDPGRFAALLHACAGGREEAA